MTTTYYVEATTDGGWAVQRVEDGTEDFCSYHRTEAEAQAALADAYKREAANDMLDALLLVERMRKAQRAYFKTKSTSDLRIAKDFEERADAAIATALARVRNDLKQGVLL